MALVVNVDFGFVTCTVANIDVANVQIKIKGKRRMRDVVRCENKILAKTEVCKRLTKNVAKIYDQSNHYLRAPSHVAYAKLQHVCKSKIQGGPQKSKPLSLIIIKSY